MNRIKIPAGTKQNFETVFDDLQTKIQANINSRLQLLLGEGLPLLKTNGSLLSSETDFKVSLYTIMGYPTRILIQPGLVYFDNGEYLSLATQQTNILLTPAASTVYLVKLVYAEVGSAPTAAQNSFLFDQVSANPYSQKNTRFTNSYSITYTALSD